MCIKPTLTTGGAQGRSAPVEWDIKKQEEENMHTQYGTPIKYTIVPLSLVKLCYSAMFWLFYVFMDSWFIFVNNF